jgi:CRP/FNR family cyclic AMP-dependent transcriptional regulator
VNEQLQFPGRDLLAGLSEKERRLFENRCRRLRYRRHSILFSQGDPVTGALYIEQGRVKTFYTSYAGKEMMLGIWAEGNIVGAADIDHGTRVVSCQGVTDCVVRPFGPEDIDYFIAKIPSLARMLVTALAFKVRWATTYFERLATDPVTPRVAYTLVTLATLHGVRAKDNRLRVEGISHADIAQMIGASRQSVTLAFGRLQKERLVQCAKRLIVIQDLDALSTKWSR